MAVSRHLIFICYKPLKSDGTSGRHFAGTDAYFGTEAVSVAVRESCGAVALYVS